MNCTTTNLVPNHENVKSYYGKAQIVKRTTAFLFKAMELKWPI